MVVLFTDLAGTTRRIGAYRIATVLRNAGIDVTVIDFTSKWNLDELIELLDTLTIEWAGFSLTYMMYHKDKLLSTKITDLNLDSENRLLEYFKNKNIPIILGGPNADIVKNYVTGYWIVVGYADLAVLAYHDHIINGTEILFETINGNSVIFADKHYEKIDLNNIFTSFCDDVILSNELIPMEIARGCIFRCKFCEFAYLGKKPGTYIRSKEDLKRNIEYNLDVTGSNTFLFLDDTFNDSVSKMEMIKEIRDEIGRPFNFWSYGRLDLLAAHPRMVELIGEIGWTAITLGIETLNKTTGSAIGKGADPGKLKQCLLDIRKRYPNIHLQANLIIGLPHSTKEDIKESVDWILDNDVVDYLRVVDLDIRDPSSKTTSSLFSQDPAKYGYSIISTDGMRYNWKTEYWTQDLAKEYADEINLYIDSRKSKNIPFHYDYYLNNIRQKLPVDNKSARYVDLHGYIAEKIKLLKG